MNRVLAHNFAGAGHQVPFKASGQNKGHVTLWVTSEGAQLTDCEFGWTSCAKQVFHEIK